MKSMSEEPKRTRGVCQFCKGLKPIQNEIRLCKTVNKTDSRVYLPRKLIGKQVEIVFSRDDIND